MGRGRKQTEIREEKGRSEGQIGQGMLAPKIGSEGRMRGRQTEKGGRKRGIKGRLDG